MRHFLCIPFVIAVASCCHGGTRASTRTASTAASSSSADAAREAPPVAVPTAPTAEGSVGRRYPSARAACEDNVPDLPVPVNEWHGRRCASIETVDVKGAEVALLHVLGWEVEYALLAVRRADGWAVGNQDRCHALDTGGVASCYGRENDVRDALVTTDGSVAVRYVVFAHEIDTDGKEHGNYEDRVVELRADGSCRDLAVATEPAPQSVHGDSLEAHVPTSWRARQKLQFANGEFSVR